MPLWIGKSGHVVATGHGIARIDAEGEQLFRYSRAGLARDADPPALEVFAVLDAEGTRAITRRRGERCLLWSAGERTLSPREEIELHDAVAIAPGELLVTVADGDRIVLRRAAAGERELTLGKAVALPPGERLRWRSHIYDEDRWPARDAVALMPRDSRARVRLHANRCGISVTSTHSGLVAVLDPGSLEPRLAVRVPAEESQFDLFALPVPQGVLVTLVADARHTEYLLVDWKGQVVAERHKLGKDAAWGASSPGLLWSDERVLVNQCSGSDLVYWLALPSLQAKIFLGEDDGGYAIDAASTADGSTHLLALTTSNYPRPHNWRLVRYDAGKARPKGVELPMPDFRPPAPPAEKPGLRRAEGPPTLAVAADATPWRAAPGEEASLGLRVVNRGGPLRGVYIEIAGNAVAENLLVAVDAVVEGAGSASFSRTGAVLRAELPEVALDAGLVDTKPKPPPEAEPSFHLGVRIRGERPGSSLMTIRVGPLGASGISGSALQGRSLVVS